MTPWPLWIAVFSVLALGIIGILAVCAGSYLGQISERYLPQEPESRELDWSRRVWHPSHSEMQGRTK